MAGSGNRHTALSFCSTVVATYGFNAREGSNYFWSTTLLLLGGIEVVFRRLFGSASQAAVEGGLAGSGGGLAGVASARLDSLGV
jgi:hypothetical protein